MMKIIVAEDNKIERREICRMLENFELPITLRASFSNGRDAFDYLMDNDVDIIISDIQMPHLNGINLIKAINENKLNTKVIFVSCYDNPDYLMSAIENNAVSYVLKPINKAIFYNTLTKVYHSVKEKKEIIQQLQVNEKIKKLAQEQILRNLIFSNATVYENDLISDLKIRKYKTVALLGIEDYNPYYNFQIDAIYELSSLKTYLSELTTEDICIYPITVNMQSLAVIIMSDSKNEDINEILENFRTYVLNDFGLNIKFGISSTKTNISELNLLYKEATEALAYTDLIFGSNIVSYNEVSQTEEINFNMIDIMKEVREIIQKNSKEEMRNIINRYLDDSQKNNEYIRKFSYALVHSMEIALNEQGKSLEDIAGSAIWTRISKFDTIINLKEWLYNIFSAAIDIMSNNHNIPNQKTVEQIKKIIEENYAERITTSYLSEKLNFSSKYLNIIFKNSTGKTIFGYLTEFRIEKAKRMLEDPESKIYVVANAVGYTRKSHFYSVFKKYTGISPYDYKLKYLSDTEE